MESPFPDHTLSRRACLAAAWLMLAGCLPAAAQQNTLVRPGESLGKIRLGMSRAQVLRILGKPSRTPRWKGNVSEDRWDGKKTPPGGLEPPHVSVLYRFGKVVQIEADSADFRTAGGLSAASSFRSIRRALRPLTVSSFVYEDWVGLYYDCKPQGLALFVGGQDTILPENDPELIMVHWPGVAVITRPGKPTRNDLDGTRG